MYYFFHAIGLLLAACVFTTTLAGPYPNIHNDISQPEPLGSRDDEKRYYIKTRVHAGDDKSKDGLYVDIYHIGKSLFSLGEYFIIKLEKKLTFLMCFSGPGQNAVVLHKEPRFQAASNGTGIRFPSYLRFDMNEDFTYDGSQCYLSRNSIVRFG